ncbi:hypothetical protein ACIBL8_41130 [Streptomyces sp. NPDC050523]|uniref:hypothetical protein n=1 Tax=Streptomyces sp. NPDC050523 TaxID=3365622 RepID=UPI003788B2CF
MDSKEHPISFDEWIILARERPALREEGYHGLAHISRQPLFTWSSPGSALYEPGRLPPEIRRASLLPSRRAESRLPLTATGVCVH